MHGPSINPCRFADVTCTFTWTLSKTRACTFPQTAWERWMDNTWKSLLDDGLDAGLMNNWLFTYQHFSAFFLLGLWNQRAEEKWHLSGRRALALSREDFPGHSHAQHDVESFYHVLQKALIMQPKGDLQWGDRKLHRQHPECPTPSRWPKQFCDLGFSSRWHMQISKRKSIWIYHLLGPIKLQ